MFRSVDLNNGGSWARLCICPGPTQVSDPKQLYPTDWASYAEQPLAHKPGVWAAAGGPGGIPKGRSSLGDVLTSAQAGPSMHSPVTSQTLSPFALLLYLFHDE